MHVHVVHVHVVVTFSVFHRCSVGVPIGGRRTLHACTSQSRVLMTLDFFFLFSTRWRNEGIVLHYINVSTPFNVTGDHLMVERPKVLQCLETDRVSQEESLRNKLERDVANAKFVEDASQEELTAKQQNQLAEENWLQYITIQGFDVLDFIIPQQKKLVGIRAETQIALDALEFSKKDRLQAEDSLTTALAKAGTRRTKEARGGDEAQGTLYVMWMHVDNAANTLGLTGVAQAL